MVGSRGGAAQDKCRVAVGGRGGAGKGRKMPKRREETLLCGCSRGGDVHVSLIVS